MGSKKNASLEGRAAELREQAREVAGQSGEAFKEFADITGGAAKDFAARTRDAAKELVESIERAAQGAQSKESHRGRKFLGITLAIGIGTAVIARDKIREALFGRRRESEPWDQRYTGGNGEAREPAVGTPEQTV
jgi:hypothetical protein